MEDKPSTFFAPAKLPTQAESFPSSSHKLARTLCMPGTYLGWDPYHPQGLQVGPEVFLALLHAELSSLSSHCNEEARGCPQQEEAATISHLECSCAPGKLPPRQVTKTHLSGRTGDTKQAGEDRE
eukprot:1147825-Pelagomonas_calceolata.AAC.1